jgi:hypothetical protein
LLSNRLARIRTLAELGVVDPAWFDADFDRWDVTANATPAGSGTR